MKTLGEEIKKKRKEQGLKVYELARRAKVDPTYITQIERGKKLPSVKLFNTINDALKLSDEVKTNFIDKKYPNLEIREWKIQEIESSPRLKSRTSILTDYLLHEHESSSNEIEQALVKTVNPTALPNQNSIKKIKKNLLVLKRSYDAILKELTREEDRQIKIISKNGNINLPFSNNLSEQQKDYIREIDQNGGKPKQSFNSPNALEQKY